MATTTTTRKAPKADAPKLPSVKVRTALRKRAGLSQTQLAALVQVSAMTMNKAERGVITLSPPTAARYAAALDGLKNAPAAANGKKKAA